MPVSTTTIMLPPQPVKGKARVHEAAEALLSMNMAATATQAPARSPSPGFLPHRIANISYHLNIVQHPVRGRMCGFGDKDRRPLTPPLIVRVSLIDNDTGDEVEIDEADASLLVCSTDLWTSDTCQEANIVVHPNFNATADHTDFNSATSPKPGYTSEPPSYIAPSQKGYAIRHATPVPNVFHNNNQNADFLRSPSENITGHTRSSSQASNRSVSEKSDDALSPPRKSERDSSLSPLLYPRNKRKSSPDNSSSSTRNLVGALHVNAHCLKDLKGQSGLFFIWHDLSVRTEGQFRLRVSLLDLCAPRRGKDNAGVVSATFTDPFDVTSAKKFAGMIDPTPLCRVFAKQGVRIPTRRGGGKKRSRDDMEDEYYEDE